MNTPAYFNIRVLQAAFCATLLLIMIPNAQAVDGYAKDAANGCAIFKPNLKAGETVAFKGACANMFGEGRGVAKWSASDGTTVTFEGNFVQGKLQGNGKMTASGGDRYEGGYKDGKREGLGVYTSANGDQFNGQYQDNQRHGHGILTLASGSLTEGEWRNGNPVSVTSRSSPGVGSAGPKLGPPQPSAAAPQTLAPAVPTPSPQPATATQPTAAATVSPPRATSGDFAMLRCDRGFLATVAVAAKEPLGLPDDDAFKFGDDGRMPGTNQATSEAVAKSNAVRLAKEAIVFARKNRAADCRLGGLPPIVSDIVLIFKDRIPEKVPIIGKDTAASVPGLNVYAEYGIGTWNLYNIGYQRKKIEAAKRKDQAKEAAFDQFAMKHNLLNKETTGLYANPFAFEGDRLFLVVGFEQMQSATTGLFYLPNEGILVVNDVPKGAFIQKGKILLAAKVLGNVKFDGVVGGLVQVHGMVPNLKFLGALICRDDRCDQTDEK